MVIEIKYESVQVKSKNKNLVHIIFYQYIIHINYIL